MIIFFKLKSKEKCSECGSTKLEEYDRKIVSRQYKYQNKDGGRDKRRKTNPLLLKIELKKRCKKCGHNWIEIVEAKSKAGEK